MKKTLEINKSDEYWSMFYKHKNIIIRVDSDGFQLWKKNDVYHRENGPAIIMTDGGEHYYLNGLHYLKEEFDKLTKERRTK